MYDVSPQLHFMYSRSFNFKLITPTPSAIQLNLPHLLTLFSVKYCVFCEVLTPDIAEIKIINVPKIMSSITEMVIKCSKQVKDII